MQNESLKLPLRAYDLSLSDCLFVSIYYTKDFVQHYLKGGDMDQSLETPVQCTMSHDTSRDATKCVLKWGFPVDVIDAFPKSFRLRG
jgi:hypothetical protein